MVALIDPGLWIGRLKHQVLKGRVGRDYRTTGFELLKRWGHELTQMHVLTVGPQAEHHGLSTRECRAVKVGKQVGAIAHGNLNVALHDERSAFTLNFYGLRWHGLSRGWMVGSALVKDQQSATQAPNYQLKLKDTRP